MIDLNAVEQHLRGAWALISGDENWRNNMALTTDGVFQSLWAIVLSAPLIALEVVAEARLIGAIPNAPMTIYSKAPLIVVMVSTIAVSFIIWIAILVTLAALAGRMQQGRAAAGLIVSYNWTQCLIYFLSAAPSVIILLTEQLAIANMLFLSLIAVSLYAFWIVLRRNLTIDVAPTIGVIVAVTAAGMGLGAFLMNIIVNTYMTVSS